MKSLLVGAWFLAGMAAGAQDGPFGLEARVVTNAGAPEVVLEFDVPEHHTVYADEIELKISNGVELVVADAPEPELKYDKFTEENKKVYAHPFMIRYAVRPADVARVAFQVRFQGCDQEACYMQKHVFDFALRGDAPSTAVVTNPVAAPPAAAGAWEAQLEGFTVGGTHGGYLKTADFLAFLDRATGAAVAEKDLFQRWGLLGGLLVILVGGLALNLTPCVLPLVPINLAIIGAGARASSRGQGFLLGGLYGTAIALVYGILGLLVVLAGAKFGALNASPWFNVAIAVIFVAMALAMFDVISVDFTRFASGTGAGAKRGRYAAAFVAGAISALLARLSTGLW